MEDIPSSAIVGTDMRQKDMPLGEGKWTSCGTFRREWS